ncbi:unnamed protein product [Hydatigera taeniaeformis]|uniref:Dual specificity protein phosphatase n=1 Tax=Hydatigena taeniaeformis TaxID=6205 RepID=A0A0R3WNP5_HYDTA|nr:unnamed protein product [Hydatigera taeniaeformis]
MGGVMSSIVPGVYVGGLTSARSESELNQCQITHICSAFQYPLSLDSRRVHKQFVVQDSPDEDIGKHFVDAADFIHGARVNHGTVLIHCACGISRSVSLTMAYLLCITDFKLRDIYKGMRAARLGACPNYGFLRQLQRFEESGDNLKARQFLLAKYGAWPAEKAAADQAAMEAHIAAQEAFIQTGYYPWDERPSPAPAQGEKPTSTRFICRLSDGASTLEEALASAPPSDQ